MASCVTPFELSDGRVGEDGRGAKSYDGEKAFSSKNHSVLSGTNQEHTFQYDGRKWGKIFLGLFLFGTKQGKYVEEKYRGPMPAAYYSHYRPD
jgi:hypothetical protein